MNRIKHYFINAMISILTFCMIFAGITPSAVSGLEDETVNGQEVNENVNTENKNKVISETQQDNSQKRESLLIDTKEENTVDQLKEKGFKESIDERTETSKTFQKGEVKETVIYSGPIHFKQNGKLVEYNNTLQKSLTRSADIYYKNSNGNHHFQIPSLIGENKSVIIDGISFSINGLKETEGEIKDNSIVYKNAQDNKDYSITSENQGLKIKTAIGSLEDDISQSYTFSLPEGYQAKLSTDKTAVVIYEGEEKKLLISANELKDADGHEVDLSDQSLSIDNNKVTITPSQDKIKMLTTAPYSMEVTIKSVTDPDYNLIKLYGVRSGDKFKNKTYAPEVNDEYTYFAQVGRDPTGSINVGVSSPENVGLCKIDFDRLVNDYIGENRRIEDAKISFRLATSISNQSTISISRLSEKMPLFDNYNNLKWTKYESYFNKYKDRNQDYSPVRLDTQTFTRKPSQKQFIDFNITDAIDYWYQGNPAYGFILEGDSADTKAQAIYNHSSQNSLSELPYMTITHVQDGPIDPNLSLDATTLHLRPFTQSNGQGLLHFSALGFDGLVRPNSDVQIQVVDTVNQKVVYDQKSKGDSTYRIFPKYDKIPNAQQYYRRTSNYQMEKLLLSDSLERNHLYQVKYKVTAYDKNGEVEATKDWTNAETFQLYKVGGFDRVSRIINFYGVKDTNQFRLDNHMFDSLLIQENLLFIRNPSKNQNKAYSSTSLTVNDKKAIDMALMGRGLHCEYGYEPVNYNTGNLYYSTQDSYFMEYGEKYYFERSYNSLADKTGIFGNNWDLNWNYQLGFVENAALFSDGTGKILTFFKNKDGQYNSPSGYRMTLTKEKVDEKVYYVDSDYYDEEEEPIQEKVIVPIYDYIIKDLDNKKEYRFNDEGFVKEATIDEYGHKMIYTYDNDNNVKEIKTSSGKVFKLTYNEDGYVTSIEMPNKTKLQYEYDEQGNLITFTDQKGYKVNYTYEGKGLLKTYTSRKSGKVILTNEFDQSGRVIKQTDAKGNTALFEYHDDYTKVTGYDGKSEYVYLDDHKRTLKHIDTNGNEGNNTYNSQNQLTSTVEDGQKTQFVYNNNGQLIQEVRSDGKKMTYEYSGNNVVKKTDFNGLSTTYEYDAQGHIIKTNNPDGTYTANRYNSDGQMTYERDVYGLEITYTYENGNKIKETDQNKHSKSYIYDALGMINSITDEEGHKTEYVRDARGQKIKEIKPSGTLNYSYDGDGNLVYEEDANGNGITYTYDDLSRLINKKDSYGSVKTEYDANGNIIKTTDELGYTKQYTYDSLGNKLSYTNEEGHSEYYKYNDKNQLIEIKDVLGIVTYKTYDELGHIIKEKRLDKENIYTYNDKGQLISKNENGIITNFKYDNNDQVIYKETNGIIEEYTYFYERMTSQTVKGAKTTFEYDVYGHKIKETDALGNSVTYKFSPSGNLIESQFANGNTIQYTYDGDHRLLSTVDGLGHKTSSEYDRNGNMTKSIDANGNVTKYTYTSRNQKASMTDPKGNVYTYQYDAKGQLIKTINPLKKAKTITYSKLGKVISTKDEIGREVKSVYDKAGNIVEEIDVKGRTVKKEYDQYARLIKSTDVYGKTTSYTYDQFDQLIKTENDYGKSEEVVYNKQGLPISKTNEKGQKVLYEYDQYGRVIKTTDIRGNISQVSYDVLGRVVSEKDSRGVITSYEFDKIGNNTVKTVDKAKTTYQYNTIGLLESETDALGRKKSYKYDKVGNVIEVIDALGHSSYNSYDANNNLIASINAKGQKTTYEYDVFNRPVKEVNPDLSFKITVYDDAGRAIKTVNEMGYEQVIEYNQLDQIVSVIDENKNKTKNIYNDYDLLSQVIAPNQVSIVYRYDDKLQLIKTIDGKANETIYEYDQHGRKTKEKLSNGYYKTYSYNQYDDIVSMSDNDGLLLEYQYNQYGDTLSTQNKLKQKTTSTYDKFGQVIEETNILGNKKITTYDILNRISSSTDERGNKTEYTYDALDRTIQTKTNDKITKQVYDSIGNLIESTDANGNTTKYDYNNRNQLIKQRDPLNHETSYTYDKLGRKLTVTDAKKQTTTYGYDAVGNMTKEINAKGLEKLYHYDAMNQMIRMQNEDKKVLDYKYDNNLNLIQISMQDQVKYSFEYNSVNLLISQKDAKNNEETYTYYLNGNQKTFTDKNGTTIHYEYNANDQLTKLSSSKLSSIYEYNEFGFITKASRGEKVSTFTYNEYGDLIEATDPHQQSVKYEYDQYGRNTKITYPSQKAVSYQYDNLDNIIKVNDGKQETTYEYDALNREVLQKTNQQEKQSLYDEIGLLTKRITKTNDKIMSYEYEYDELGNTVKEVSHENDRLTTKEYTYDHLNQLINSKHVSDKLTKSYKYTYDDSGNRILYEEDVNGKKTSKHSSYNANDELLTEGKATYQYDDNGNIIEKIFEDNHKEELEYNDFNELIAIRSDQGRVIEYDYDALGNRISKNEDISVNGKAFLEYIKADAEMPDLKDMASSKEELKEIVGKKVEEYHEKLSKKNYCSPISWMDKDGIHLTTNYVNDITYENTQVLELQQNKQHEEYVYGNSRISMEMNNSIMNYVYDGRNNVVSKDGQLDKIYQYHDFGNVIQNVDDKYTYSQEYTEYDYQYLRARYYETTNGRFLSRDNYLGKDNINEYNQYIYALNNPSMYQDPTGHSWIDNALNGLKKGAEWIGNKAAQAYDAVVSTAKKAYDYVDKHVIQPAAKIVNNAWNAAKKEISKFSQKVDKAFKDLVLPKKKVDDQLASVKKEQVINTTEKFIDYANQFGLDAARKKIKDTKQLEAFIEAYCDKFGLDKLSVTNALKGIEKVNSTQSLSTKYSTIYESIRNSSSGDKSQALSVAGYSSQSTMNKHYLSSAADTLEYARSLSIGDTYSQPLINGQINKIYAYKSGTSALTSEYVSSMTVHSANMKGYIQSGKGLYKPVQQWYSTGTYSSGAHKTTYLHQETDAYRLLGSSIYQDSVSITSQVQEKAQWIELGAAILGAANQAYNPYTSYNGATSSTKGGSQSTDYYNKGNSSVGNSLYGDTGNSTAPSNYNGTVGNSTTNGYVTSGNTNPGYVAPSSPNTGLDYVPSTVPNTGIVGANGAGTSYNSFYEFKKANPTKVKGNHWHHIVEQSQQEKSGFSVQQINNTNNLIELTPDQHREITGHYNSKSYPFTHGLSIRDWLAGQSFEAQYEFGINKLKELGFIK